MFQGGIDWITVGLIFDAVGAIVVVLPEIPWIRKQISTSDSIQSLECAQRELIESIPSEPGNRIFTSNKEWENHLNPSSDPIDVEEEQWFQGLCVVINKFTDVAPSRVSVFHDDRGTTGIRIFHQEPSDTPKGQAGKTQIEAVGTVLSWIESEIENRRQKFHRIFISCGAGVLAVGFAIQILSRIGLF